MQRVDSQLVIPMAGSGSRFADAGYVTPKPLLEIHGVPMYQVVLANVLHDSVSNVVIVARGEWQLGPHIDGLSKATGLRIRLIEVEQTTGGPADTVDLALPFLSPGEAVIVANSDQYVDASMNAFYKLCQTDGVQGAVLAMEDEDPKWSYVAVDERNRAIEIREKEVISSLATVGIYGFESPEMMSSAFTAMRKAGDQTNGEWFVAPSYNYMISSGDIVEIVNLGPIGSVMHGLGIPSDYEDFLRKSVAREAASRARLLLA
jgi:NDP-sugar pyrophosphorylase family protein